MVALSFYAVVVVGMVLVCVNAKKHAEQHRQENQHELLVSKKSLRSHHHETDHAKKSTTQWGHFTTLNEIYKDLQIVIETLPTLSPEGYSPNTWTIEDMIVQSGTPSVIYGCPPHFMENDSDGDDVIDGRSVFPDDNLGVKMNDIDLWVKNLRVDPDKIDPTKFKSTGEQHLKIKPNAVGNKYEIEMYGFDTSLVGQVNEDKTPKNEYEDRKLKVWPGPTYALDKVNAMEVRAVPCYPPNEDGSPGEKKIFYSLSPDSSANFKLGLVHQSVKQRAKGYDDDFKYKHYQDAVDLICLCQVAHGVTGGAGLGFPLGDGGGNPATSNPLLAAPVCGEDAARKALYNECINPRLEENIAKIPKKFGSVALDPEALPLDKYYCPALNGAIEDPGNCKALAEAPADSRSLFDQFKC